MLSNTVLQYGTALSKNCVFSSLRQGQDLIRRLSNTSLLEPIETRLKIIKTFLQQLINSYIASID